jgi:hypothetical protein
LLVTVDKPSVVPAETRLHSDQPYPGLGVLGYFHAVPSGPPGSRQSFASLRNLIWTGLICGSSFGHSRQSERD